MRIVHFEKEGVPGIAADDGSGWHGLTKPESGFPGTLPELIAQGADLLRRGKDLLPMQAIDLPLRVGQGYRLGMSYSVTDLCILKNYAV